MTLGGAPDSLGGITGTLTLQRDSKGRFYHVNDLVSSVIQVFGSDGVFIRSIGRTGSGPGEYRFIRSFLVGPGDSIHIFDPTNARYTVLDPEFRIMRETRSRYPTRGVALLGPGRVVVNAVVTTRGGAGFPLHELGPGGSLKRSFGSELPYAGPGFNGLRMSRVLAIDSAGLLWAAHMNAYEIDVYTETGRLVRQIKRDVEWFKPYDDLGFFDEKVAPPPIIMGIAITQTELWVLIQVPGADWRKHLVRAPSKIGGTVLKPDRADKFYETILEVLDPVSGDLIVSQRVPRYLRGFLGSGEAFAYEDDGSGVGTFTIWRINVTH